ncbi:MAG: FAD:protein FMN transferase [Ruthenibacterium sp.]
MNENIGFKKRKKAFTALAILCVIALCVGLYCVNMQKKRYALASFAMSTIVDQKAYGPHANKAMQAVEQALAKFEAEFSLYQAQSDIAKINAAAGGEAVAVKPETFALLKRAKELSSESENAFAVTLAPLSLAWGVTSEHPQVLTQTQIDALLPLVNDADILLDETAGTVKLAKKGQAIDLGGIAKGTACTLAENLYTQYGVKSALLSIGGNIYAKGTKPDGSLYRIGFRDPLTTDTQASIASITMQDEVLAVSGGYERFFEKDGVRYHHILDPKTGAPANSDIVSVGVIDKDGTVADFYSTTLFVWGKERALQYFRDGGRGMLLDNEKNLYVSKDLQDSFELVESAGGYTVVFI